MDALLHLPFLSPIVVIVAPWTVVALGGTRMAKDTRVHRLECAIVRVTANNACTDDKKQKAITTTPKGVPY